MADQDNRLEIARGLLGGYATNSLTDDERRLLIEVALEDQDLFDDLAREQALKNALEVPGVRDRLAASLAPSQVAEPVRGWVKPLMFGIATMFVLGVSITAVWLSRNGDRMQIAGNNGAIAQQMPAAPPPQQPPAAATEQSKKKAAPTPGSAAKPATTNVPSGTSVAIADQPVPATAAAPPPPPPGPEVRADLKDEKVKDGRAGFMPLAATPAAAPAAARRATQSTANRFAFDYSIDGQDIVFKFYADGYFSLHIAPGGLTIVDSRVHASETRREHITTNGTEATVTFSAVPQAPPGGVSIERGKDALSGTVEDPSHQRIDFLLKFFWY